MTYRAVLTGAGLLIVFASCGAPDGNSLFRSYVDEPTMPSGGASGAAGAAAGSGGAPAGDAPLPSGGTDMTEGLAADIGLVSAGGNPGRPLSTGMSPGDGVPSAADAGEGSVADAGVLVDAAPPPPPCSSNVELCDGLDNDCDDAVDEGAACAADCAGFALVDRGYMFCSASVVRDVAADRCELEGMRLAWIETEEENEFLVDSIAAADVPAPADDEVLTYMGASDSGDEGNWIWRGRGVIADGFQFWQQGANLGTAVNGAFESWSPGEPNNTDDDENCGALSVFGGNNRVPGNWDDRDCDSELPFVCEVP